MSPSLKPNARGLDRRTVTVWVTLVASMTAVAGILLILEPMPSAPVGGVVLTSLDGRITEPDALFQTQPTIVPGRWGAILIHHSGENHGSARSLSHRHQQAGFEGLRYHFVIGNGDGAEDGEIEVGYRWTRQLPAEHAVEGRGAEWFRDHAIAICLVGDADRKRPTEAQMRQLTRLVIALQRQLEIPAQRVLQHANVTPDPAVRGLMFPASEMRRQLIDPVAMR